MNENNAPIPSLRDRQEGASRSEVRSAVRVRLRKSGRIVDCDSNGLVLRQGEQVVVDDRREIGIGTVTAAAGTKLVRARVLRRAEARDVARAEQEQTREAEALNYARGRARALGLPIKLFRVDLGQTGERATFSFSCEQRVDFRALVRDLAAYLHARVEMRQVGVRDESKLTGGIGSCGRELCCATYLARFAAVSIKMAKHQRLVLNQTKIGGQCGRLKCCLVYEDDLYVEMSKGLPKAGKKVETPEGMGRVDDLDVLGGRVRVSFAERAPMFFAASEVRLLAAEPNGAKTPTPQPRDLPPRDLPPSDTEDGGSEDDEGEGPTI